MAHEAASTLRARRLLERRANGIVMIAPVEVGELLVGNGLLKRHQADDQNPVGEACRPIPSSWHICRVHAIDYSFELQASF